MGKNFFLLWGCFLFLTLSVWAQEPTVQERIIYIPYEKLEQLIKNDDKGIYLPYKDYEKLLKEVEAAREKPSTMPNVVMISNATYDCQVKGPFLEVKASYKLDVLEAGWHNVSLGLKNIAIKHASLDDKPAYLNLNETSYELLFKSEAPGQHDLKLSFVVEVSLGKAMEASVSFQVPRSPIAQLNLTIPREGDEGDKKAKMKVDVYPSLMSKVTSDEEKTQVEALLGNTNEIRVNWQSQAERKVEIKKIVNAENLTRLQIGENFLNINSLVRYDVIQGSLKQASVEIPEGFKVFAVKSLQGASIQDWTLSEDQTQIEINFLGEVTDQGEGKTDLELEIKLERIIKKLDGRFALPVLKVSSVEREKGFYTISLNDLHTLKVVQRKDISQIDINDLPSYVSRSAVQFAFKYLKSPFTIDVELEKIDPEYEVWTNITSYLDETLYKLHAHLKYDIKKSRIFQSKVEIPAGFMLLNIKAYDLAAKGNERYLDQIKEYKEQDENGKHLLLITFKKGMHTNNLTLRLQFQKKFAQEQASRELDLPVFRVLGAKRETGNVGIGVKSSFNITTIDDSQKNIFPLDIRELFRQGDAPPKQQINIGFRYFDHPIMARFKMEKRKPVISAEVFNYVSITENLLKYQLQIFYDVKYTGVKKFSFTLPEEIAAQVPISRITDTLKVIKEINRVEQKEEKNVLYTVQTQRDILGTYQVNVEYETKLKQLTPGMALDINIFELKTQETERENGFVVFKKNNNLSLDIIASKLVETTDINDPNFRKRGQKTDVLAIYKYNTRDYELTMRLQKLQFEPVLNTIINRLHISTTVNKDLSTQNEAVVCLVNNRKQFLDFELPENSKIISVARLTQALNYRRPAHEIDRFLAPITPSVKGGRGKGFRVNIASNTQKDAPFVLVIKYTHKLANKSMGYTGDCSFEPLSFGDIPVNYFTWDLGLPNEYHYMKLDSDMVRYYPSNYGIWHALFSFGNVDSSVIKQDAETGVIPIYDIQGKLFSFAKMSKGGNITVSYLYDNWLHTLYLLCFLAVFLLIIFLPRVGLSRRLPTILFLVVLSLLLSSLNLQGYKHFYIVILWAVIASGSLIAGGNLLQALSNRAEGKKAHVIHREEKKSEKDEPKKDESKKDDSASEKNNEEKK